MDQHFLLKVDVLQMLRGLESPPRLSGLFFLLLLFFFFFIVLSPQAIFIYTVHWAVFLLPKKHDLYFTSQDQGLPDQNHEIW